MKKIRQASLSVALIAAACIGCGKEQKGGERLKVFPVSGEVFVDGVAAKDAMVFLHPATPHQLPEGARPISSQGQVDETGKFVISTYGSGDGVPTGSYKVTVTWLQAVGMSGRLDGADRLKGKYSDPQKSGIVVEVAESPVAMPRIELATK